MKIITKVVTTVEVDYGPGTKLPPGDLKEFCRGLEVSWRSGQIKDILVVNEIMRQVYGVKAQARVVDNVFTHSFAVDEPGKEERAPGQG